LLQRCRASLFDGSLAPPLSPQIPVKKYARFTLRARVRQTMEKGSDMNTKRGLLAALIAGAMLTACATTGTRVSSTSDAYRDLAKGQQTWCKTFGGTCTCFIDGVQTTCSLVYACLNSGNCKAAQ
jgi:hypothetical protein